MSLRASLSSTQHRSAVLRAAARFALTATRRGPLADDILDQLISAERWCGHRGFAGEVRLAEITDQLQELREQIYEELVSAASIDSTHFARAATMYRRQSGVKGPAMIQRRPGSGLNS